MQPVVRGPSARMHNVPTFSDDVLQPSNRVAMPPIWPGLKTKNDRLRPGLADSGSFSPDVSETLQILSPSVDSTAPASLANLPTPLIAPHGIEPLLTPPVPNIGSNGPRISDGNVDDPVVDPLGLGSDVMDVGHVTFAQNTDSLPRSVTRELQRLQQQIDDLETARVAHEDATRTIIRRSFYERGSNINEFVIFGGTLETLAGWVEDFDGVAESFIELQTAQLDFEIQVNDWTLGSIIFEYDDGTNVLFPTNEGDEFFVDRINVDTAFATIGNTQKCPPYVTVGRMVVPFGISTGDPVADVLSIEDPLTVEVFETKEDAILIGFEWPTPPPPRPAKPPSDSKTKPPPGPPKVRPIFINPLVRKLTRYCCPCLVTKPPTPPGPYVPPPCLPPLSAAIYFYNGNTFDGGEDHIEHLGGTLGYRTKGFITSSCIPWTMELDVDYNSSVFDSDFLQFEYRRFLGDIDYVSGMAAHAKSSLGPFALVLEWNGAINDAKFVDDLGQPYSILPNAWQISLGYQFDWNPWVEVIGNQGTYFVMGYSQSDDLAGATRVIDGENVRVGFVPERRFLVGFGEWVLEGLRVAVEYSHIVDYEKKDGGTGHSAEGWLAQLTYEW